MSTNDAFTARQVVRPRAQVEAQIREAILSGQFGQGEKLPPETELAEKFGVSRPTVREALGSLVTAGLIRKVPGVSGGSFVNTVTHDSLGEMLGDSVNTILRLGTLDIAEVTGVRRIVEIPAARMAAENRTSDHLQQLRDIVEQQRTTTLDDPNIPLFDLAFHTTIADASGNRLLAAFVSALHSSTHPAHYLELSPEVGRRTVKQHIAIVAAIEAQNPAGAAEAMDAHLEYVLRYSTVHPKGPIG